MELKKTITVIQFPDEMKRKLHTGDAKCTKKNNIILVNANNESNRI